MTPRKKKKNKPTPAYSQNTGNMSPKSKHYLCWNSPEICSDTIRRAGSWKMPCDSRFTCKRKLIPQGHNTIKNEALWDSVLQRFGINKRGSADDLVVGRFWRVELKTTKLLRLRSHNSNLHFKKKVTSIISRLKDKGKSFNLQVLATIPYFNFYFFPHLLIFLQFRDPSCVLNLSTNAVLQKWHNQCKRTKYLHLKLIFRRA